MTEQEIIEKQRKSNNTELYLLRVGMFFHAYDAAAFAVARLTGYKVMRRQRRMGEVLTCGFPTAKLQDVKTLAEKAGAVMRHATQDDDSLWLLTGADAAEDPALIAADEGPATGSMDKNELLAELKEVRRELLGINLAELSPKEVVLSVRNIQIRCLAHI